jgi:exonuclease SbcC
LIKSVKIKNFQVHKNTEIELSPGVNVITGDTDAGKSSLMRALRLVVFNRPTGDSIIRWGEKEVKVSVSTTDNQHIERVKSKKENSYLLNSEELKAVGKDVPERVAQALNLSDTNFQKQLDRPFLLLESPGEIAQFFNSIVGLSDIDKSLYNIQREFSQAKNQLGMYETELDKTKEEHQKYNYLEEVELILKELEIQILESKVLDNEIESLLLFSTQIDRVDKQLAGITIPPDVSSLLLSVQQYNTLNKEYEQVATWFTNLKQINDAISK